MAEDAVQEGFLSLWRSGTRYNRARGSVRPWVLGVVHNRAIDAFRCGAIRESRDVSDEGAAERNVAPERTEDQVGSREDARGVRAALGRLPAAQRGVIELAYLGGFTHSEIAAMLELPSGTVKSRMRLGLAKMRFTLGDPAEVPR